MMKRLICLMMCLVLMGAWAMAEEKLDKLPDALLFTQRQTKREYVDGKSYATRMYPQTYNGAVDAELAQLIDAMHARALPNLPRALGKKQEPNYLTTGANITRTGDRWLSFLTIARVDHDRRQTYVDFDARVYDMVAGQRITLSDLFAEDCEAWDVMGEAVREQLSAYFEGTAPDAAALDALCTRQALLDTPFTLTPACLRLHYRADALYPGREQLMHVQLFYNELRPMMTELGRRQTDNSMYKMVALTFDDGVSHYDTNAVYDRMREYGAAVTFFVVGMSIRENGDMLSANHDAGHQIGSHNYEHVNQGLTQDKLLRWKARFDAELNDAIGIRPRVMRAPGGTDIPYIKAGVGLPMMHWSVNPNDATGRTTQQVITMVSSSTHDGDIVLMHDNKQNTREYSAQIVKNLTDKGFLCVTVEELYAAHGKALLPDTIYYGGSDVLN